MTDLVGAPALTQLVLKPTIFCYHRCSYCDLRQDYYSDLVADRKTTLRLEATPQGGRRANPGHMPRDMAFADAVPVIERLGLNTENLP